FAGAFLARDPAPARADMSPAAVVEGCETPWSGVHPGPTPGRDIRPLTVPIGNPGRRDGRIPDLAIIRRLRPLAIGLQVLAARHVCNLGWDRCRPLGWRTVGPKSGGKERVADRRANAALEGVGPGHRRGLVGRDFQGH